ncbi:MAG: hypothetical protein L0Y56_22805 [Nitrospira sp.]|nr:hypothetical protein [Nitrospira sp.]
MENLKPIIETKLSCLIGLPLLKATRAANMECFHFGHENTVRDWKGNQKMVGEFALHVQCAWRIWGAEGIVVGSQDIYYPSGDPLKEPKDFDWGVPGSTRCDERIERFFQDYDDNLPVVEEIEADFTGGAKIRMKGGLLLEIFPNDSLDKEHWRLFAPATEAPHFVVTGQGIEK